MRTLELRHRDAEVVGREPKLLVRRFELRLAPGARAQGHMRNLDLLLPTEEARRVTDPGAPPPEAHAPAGPPERPEKPRRFGMFHLALLICAAVGVCAYPS